MKRPFRLVLAEGQIEIPVLRRILHSLGIPSEFTAFHPGNGRSRLLQNLDRYNRAARTTGPILVLADLEQDPCASGLIRQRLSGGCHPDFIFRLAVRMIESWLLADGDALAKFLDVPAAIIPMRPDDENNPKQVLVNLARRSSRRDIVADIVPGSGSRGIVGKGYTPRIGEYIDDFWRPTPAQERSPSLARALAAIRRAASA